MISPLRSTGFWVIVSSICLAIASNIAVQHGGMTESSSFAQEQGLVANPAKILREGVVLPEMVGVFRVFGDRIQFAERDGGRPFRCLENLMLQRVHQVIGDEPSETAWIVSGRVTEFRGENFLLLEMIRRTK